MTSKKYIQTLILILTANLAFSQNIVPNPSFETYNALPTGYGQWYNATGWSNLNLYPFFAWPYASPDYLHMTGGGGADLPVCTFGTVTPATGSAVVGLVTWLSGTANFREYIAIGFSTPMIVGQAYTVTFNITNGSAGWYCGYSSNHIGIRFSESPLVQLTNEPVGGIPQLEYVGELWNTAWQLVSFSFVADLPYNYITIGNFYNDLSTAHTYRVASLSAGAYYFLDDISVVPDLPLPLTLTAFEVLADNNKIDLNWQTSSEMNTDYFTIEKSANGDDFEAIGQVTAAGNSSNENYYQFIDYEPISGTAYYRIKTTDLDHGIYYSEIKSVMYSIPFDNINIYPNPCFNELNINLPSDNVADIHIIDFSGHEIFNAFNVKGMLTVSTGNLAAGVYLIVINNNQTTYNLKFVKQ